jgi:serine protease Do
VSVLFTLTRRRKSGITLSALALAAGLSMAAPLPVLAFGAPESFAELADKISPSVVNITTSSLVSGPADGGPMVPEGSPFEDFFDQFQNPDGSPRRSEALGSGFVISEDGYIVTNNHVIEGADEIEIEFFGGEKLPAKLVGTDPKTDIALLKVESRQAAALRRLRQQRPDAGGRLGGGDGQPAGPGLLGLGRHRLGPQPRIVGHL